MRQKVLPLIDVKIQYGFDDISSDIFYNMIHDADIPNVNRKNLIHQLLDEPQDPRTEANTHIDGIPRRPPLNIASKEKLVNVLYNIWRGLGYNKAKPSPHENTRLQILQSVNVSNIIGNRSDYTSEHDFTTLLHALFSLRNQCAKSNTFAHVLNKKAKLEYDYDTCTYGMVGIHIGSLTGQLTSIRQMPLFNSFLDHQNDSSYSTSNVNTEVFNKTRDLLRSNTFFIKDMSTLCDSAPNTQILNFFKDNVLMLLGTAAIENTDVIYFNDIEWDQQPVLQQQFVKDDEYESVSNIKSDDDGFVLQTYRLTPNNSQLPFLQWTYKIRTTNNSNNPSMNHDEDISVDDIFIAGKLIWSSRTWGVHPSFDSVIQTEHLYNHSYRGIKAKRKWSQFSQENDKIDFYERLSLLFTALPESTKPTKKHIRLFIVLLIKSLGDIGIAMSSRYYNDKFHKYGAEFFTWTNDTHIWPFYNKICDGRVMLSSNEKLNQGILLPYEFFSESIINKIMQQLGINTPVQTIPRDKCLKIVQLYFLYIRKKLDFLQLKNMVLSTLSSSKKYHNFVPNSLFQTNEDGWTLCTSNERCKLVKNNQKNRIRDEYTRYLY